MLQSTKYFLSRYCLFRDYLTATADKAFQSIKLKFKIEDCVGRSIYKKGVYEPENGAFLLTFLDFSAPKIILDIGANIGWYSILLDKVSANGTQIFSFEPDDLNHQLLSHNMLLNETRKITAIKKGVSDKAETKELYLYPNKNRGRHSLIKQPNLKSIQIETTTLDSFTKEQNITDVYFLKIDIEGYEYYAFKGGEETLKRTQNILMEYSPHLYQSHTAEALLNLLYDKGFKSHRIQGQTLVPTAVSDILNTHRQIDLFWTR